jgi:serine/threonine protein kinase
LKPQNIGFDVRGHVKVFDFGLAKYLAPELKVSRHALQYNLTGQCGSFPYMAPEVVLRTPYNEKCDVFSFGILLYEILALKPAFLFAQKGHEFVTKVVKGGRRPSHPKELASIDETSPTNILVSITGGQAFDGDGLHPDPRGFRSPEGC